MSTGAGSTSVSGPALRTEISRYAVIDLAVAEQLRPVIARLMRSAAEPLLAHKFAQELLEVGPWLVKLSAAPEVDSLLGEMDPGVPWGYYVHSTVDIVSLRQTLRRFNLAVIPDTPRPVLFRYWDPRVMGVFLKVASREQRARMFEWIERIEAANGGFDEVRQARQTGGNVDS